MKSDTKEDVLKIANDPEAREIDGYALLASYLRSPRFTWEESNFLKIT